VLPGGEGLVIHVSRLAAHTRNMLGHAGVSLMVMAPRPPDTPPEGLARVTIQGQARPLSSSDPAYATARQAYLSRLPSTEALFGFGDFSLFVIVPATLRLVGGFGQAHSLPGEALRVVMAGADAPGAV
jgi:putative heme iron utilization protein